MDRSNETHSRDARVLRMALAVGVILSLAACGRSEAPPAEQPVAEPAPVAAAAASPEVVMEAPAKDEAVTPPETPEAAPAPVLVEAAPVKATPPPPPEKPAAFASCGGCHSVEEGGRNGIGPNLFGVMGRQVGGKAGYAYSDAMAANGETWTPDLMDAFLAGPRDVVPGTKMMAAPVRNAETRQALVEYLSSLR